jgi:CheY-like chemotaxis protein
MPVMDGFTATSKIRRLEAERRSSKSDSSSKSHIHIVALTGLARQQDEDDAFNAGVDTFITKPVKFDNLTKLLQHLEGELGKNPDQPG